MSILNLGAAPAEPPLTGAGFGIRGLARLIDIAFHYVMAYLSGMAGGLTLHFLQKLSVTDAGWPFRLRQGHIFHVIVTIVAGVLYQAVCEAGCGASLGKFFCGLRVLSEKLTPCDFYSALIRSAAYLVDALFFGVVGYLSMNKTALQQRHGDHWAGTIVLRRSRVPAAALRPESNVVSAILLGVLVYVTITGTAIVLTSIR